MVADGQDILVTGHDNVKVLPGQDGNIKLRNAVNSGSYSQLEIGLLNLNDESIQSLYLDGSQPPAPRRIPNEFGQIRAVPLRVMLI